MKMQVGGKTHVITITITGKIQSQRLGGFSDSRLAYPFWSAGPVRRLMFWSILTPIHIAKLSPPPSAMLAVTIILALLTLVVATDSD